MGGGRMNRIVWAVLLIALSPLCVQSQQQPEEQKSPQPEIQSVDDSPVLREPFTLKLLIDNRHYEERYDERIPYVANNSVCLFAGESFGVNFIVSGGQIIGLRYEPDKKKADVFFEFSQEEGGLNSPSRMMLWIQNYSKRWLELDAVVSIPKQKKIFRTSIIPVGPGMKNIESWPYPIAQLVLRNLRFSEQPGKATRPKRNQAK